MYLKKHKETFLFIQTCNAIKTKHPTLVFPKFNTALLFCTSPKTSYSIDSSKNLWRKVFWYGFPLKILYNSHDQSSFSCCPCFLFFFSQTVFVKRNSVFTFLYLVMALKKLRVDYS